MAVLFVESGVCKIDVLLIHAFLGQRDGLTETLEVDDLPLTEEADHIVDVRIIGEAQNIIIGKAGLLFCRDLVRTTFSAFARI